MKICLLLLRYIRIFDHQHQKLLPELEIENSLQHLLIIKPAILDILPDLGERPPFPIELLSWQVHEGAEFLNVLPLLVAEHIDVGENDIQVRYEIGISHLTVNTHQCSSVG